MTTYVRRRLLPYRGPRKDDESIVRGRSVRVLHHLPGRVFVQTTDQRAGGNWSAWLTQSEFEDGW